VLRYDVQVGGQIAWNQSEVEITDLFNRGLLTRTSQCRLAGTSRWQELNDFFPLLKYRSVGGGAVGLVVAQPPPLNVQIDDRGKPVMTSALKAGWICFGLGAAVAWIFPPGYGFYSIALILAIIAMCTHQVNRGIILLLSSFVGIGTSAMISFFLAVGLVSAAVAPAVAKAQKMQAEQQRMNQDLLVAQQRAIAALNRTIPPPPPPIWNQPPTTPAPVSFTPISKMSARQVFDEIARLEKQQRKLRKIKQDLSPANLEYLHQLRDAPSR